MIEIREIVGVEALHSFYNENPDKVHIVLFDDKNNHEPDCIGAKLENIGENETYDALMAIADMTNIENEPLVKERDFYNFPSLEFTKSGKSYFRFQGNMTLDEFYDIISNIEKGYYLPDDEEGFSEIEDNEIEITSIEEE